MGKYDTNYRCLEGKSGRFVGARSFDWDGIGGWTGEWSGALGASFDMWYVHCYLIRLVRWTATGSVGNTW